MTQTHLAKSQLSGRRSPLWRAIGLGVSLLLLLGSLALGLTLGAADIDIGTVWEALTSFDGTTNHLIVTTVRLPRVIAAAVVGAALAVAGALMQGLTHNSLADPGILGISAGATFAVVITTFLFDATSIQTYTWVAFAGGAIAAVAVYMLSSIGRRGITPLKLILSGTVLSYLLSAFTTGTLILSQRTLDEIRFWLAGSVAGRDLEVLLPVLPYLLLGLLIAFGLGRQITAMVLYHVGLNAHS